MNRTLLIAQREVMAYVKTWGFWLSLLSLPFFAALGGFAPILMQRAEPVHAYVVVDETEGGTLAPDVRRALNAEYDRSVLSSMAMAAVPEAGMTGRDAVRAATATGGYDAGLATLKQVAPRAAASFKAPRRGTEELPTPADLVAAPAGEAKDALAREWVERDGAIDGRDLSAVVILTPIFLPVAKTLGIDPLFFGVLMVVNLAIGLYSPPVGTTLFIGSMLAKASIGETVKELLPFYAVGLIVLGLMTYVPALTLHIS